MQETDHKPLLPILGPSKCISTMAATRFQRYATFLTEYTYDIKYQKTDALSGLPLPTNVEKLHQDDVAIIRLSQIESAPDKKRNTT